MVRTALPHTFTEYTRNEQLADKVVHLVAVVASVIATSVLIGLSISRQDFPTTLSVSIYGISTVAVFVISSVYHSTPASQKKALLRRCDHAAIFVKIAGTYTPLAYSIGGPLGRSILTAVWSIAVVGVALKLGGWRGGEKISVVLYLVQGWLVLLAIGPLRAALEPSEAALGVFGGVLYTVGCPFYLTKQLPFNNAIWHSFVLAASACFYAAILKAVVLR